MADKSRLVGCLLLLLLLLFLVPILVVLRWNQERRRQDDADDAESSATTTFVVPWMIVCIPVWMAFAVAIVGQGVRLLMAATTTAATISATGVVWLLELCAWCTGVVLTVWQWDNSHTSSSMSWHIVAIPFYIGHALHSLKGYLSIRAIQVQQAYMISEVHLREELHVDDIQDLTEEQQRQYTVVTTDHDTVAHILSAMSSSNNNDDDDDNNNNNILLGDEELEALRVHTSPEFTAAEQAILRRLRSTVGWILCYVPWTILVAFQLGSWNQSVSWWIIFIPLWIYWGFPLLLHWFVCCCAGPPLDDDDDDDDGEEDVGEGDAAVKKAEEGQTDSQANTSQMMFQSVDGSMSQLNSFNTSVDDSTGVMNNNNNNTSSASLPPGDVVEGASPTKQSSTTTTTTPMKREEPSIPSTASPIPPSDPSPTRGPMPRSNHKNDNGDDDDDDFPELSPEFVDAKFKALAACCGSTVQIGLLCMVVALLQDPDAYNAMWILFPGFVFGGLLLCLCCCCIYAPPLVDAHGNPLHGGGGNKDDDDGDEDDLFVYKMDTPKHMVPPPSSAVAANHPAVAGTSIPEEGDNGDVEAQNGVGRAPTAEAKEEEDDNGKEDPTASSMDDLD